MKTDELVALLAGQAEAIDPRAGARRWTWALGLAAAAGLALTGGLLGFNPDLVRDAALPMFWAKQAFCAVLAVSGCLVAARLGRPGQRPAAALGGIALAMAAMWALAAAVFLLAPPAQRSTLLMGQTALVCPWLIALVSAPAFIGFFWLLQGLAPTRLRLAGAAAGFAAGATGAWIYAFHCPEYGAPFLGVWYVLGMAIPTALGALCGPRLLRW